MSTGTGLPVLLLMQIMGGLSVLSNDGIRLLFVGRIFRKNYFSRQPVVPLSLSDDAGDGTARSVLYLSGYYCMFFRILHKIRQTNALACNFWVVVLSCQYDISVASVCHASCGGHSRPLRYILVPLGCFSWRHGMA